MYLQVAEGSHLTPLPVEEDASSLSAILLDNDYYNFIRAGRRRSTAPLVGAAQLVALKARAWLDLTARASAVNRSTARQSRNTKTMSSDLPDPRPAIDPMAPEAVKRDIGDFIARMRAEEIDVKSSACYRYTHDVLAEIARDYRLAESE